MVEFLYKQKGNFEYTCREEWIKNFLMIIPKSSYIAVVSNNIAQSPSVTIYTPTIDDILANDWIIKAFN